jgi:NADPH2:quinone reductase
VIEAIGQETFLDSAAVLQRGGHLCLVGAASGENFCFIAWDLLQNLHLTGYSSEKLTGADLREDMRVCLANAKKTTLVF